MKLFGQQRTNFLRKLIQLCLVVQKHDQDDERDRYSKKPKQDRHDRCLPRLC